MSISLQEIAFYVVGACIALCSILAVTTGRILRAATYLLFVLLLLQLPLPRFTYQALLPLFRTQLQALPDSPPFTDIACPRQAWRPFNNSCSPDIVQDFSGLTLPNFPSTSSISSQ